MQRCPKSSSPLSPPQHHSQPHSLPHGARSDLASPGQPSALPASSLTVLCCVVLCHGVSVGRPKHVRVMAGAAEGDVFVGDAAKELRGLLKLNYPTKHGITTDWEDMHVTPLSHSAALQTLHGCNGKGRRAAECGGCVLSLIVHCCWLCACAGFVLSARVASLLQRAGSGGGPASGAADRGCPEPQQPAREGR